MSEKNEDTLQEIIKSWHDMLIFNKKFSIHTGKAYFRDIEEFIKFFSQYKKTILNPQILGMLSLSDFRKWLINRTNCKFLASSTARAVSAIKNFYEYLEKLYDISNEDIKHLRAPKIAKSLPKALSETDSFEAINHISDFTKDAWVAARDTAILTLIYGSGIRINEAINLKKNNIMGDYIKVKGKGNKERIIPLIPEVKISFEHYFALIPFKIENDDFIFRGLRGAKLQATILQRNLQKLRRLIGLPEHTTPHAFRHSFATHLLNSSGNLRMVQELLGHVSLSTTQKYTEISHTQLLNNYKKFHPFAKDK